VLYVLRVVVLQGKRLVFVTNNSTKSRAGYLGKFTGLGLNVNAVRHNSSSSSSSRKGKFSRNKRRSIRSGQELLTGSLQWVAPGSSSSSSGGSSGCGSGSGKAVALVEQNVAGRV
jgi:hypothetical protein